MPNPFDQPLSPALRATLGSLAAVSFFGLLLACVLVFPRYLVDGTLAPAADQRLTPPERLKAENDVRTTLLQVLGGLLLAGGASAAWWQLQLSRQQLEVNRGQLQHNLETSREELHLTREGQEREARMALTVIEKPSPNWNSRGGAAIDCIVIHDTECDTAQAALAWFESPTSKVSSHCVIDRDGTVYRCVPDDARAWHVGQSEFEGREDVNSFSLGIELVGFAAEPYTEAQVDALVELCTELCLRYPAITIDRIVGHQDIAVPVGRKTDPGPYFPWDAVRGRVQAGLNQRVA